MFFEMRFDLGTLDSGERSLPFGLLVCFFIDWFFISLTQFTCLVLNSILTQFYLLQFMIMKQVFPCIIPCITFLQMIEMSGQVAKRCYIREQIKE